MPKYIRFPKDKKVNSRVEWAKAPDINRRLTEIIGQANLGWLKINGIYGFRSKNSKSRAFARIWGLPRIWQIALNRKPSYVIEVISERFDKLSEKQKTEVLIHEIAHIPKNFSGSLTPHFKRGNRKFKDLVNNIVAQYNRK